MKIRDGPKNCPRRIGFIWLILFLTKSLARQEKVTTRERCEQSTDQFLQEVHDKPPFKKSEFHHPTDVVWDELRKSIFLSLIEYRFRSWNCSKFQQNHRFGSKIGEATIIHPVAIIISWVAAEYENRPFHSCLI